MIKESVGTTFGRVVALAVAFAAAALVALAIAPGTALAAQGVPIPSASPSDAGSVYCETEGDLVTYTASPNSGNALDHWGIGNQAVNPDPYYPNRLKMSIADAQAAGSVTAYFKKTSDKQDWTGAKTIEKTADYGSSGSVSIAGYLPSDYGSYLEIPEDSVSVSDPDSVLDSWSFDNESLAVNFKFTNDASKAGKSATISATVKSEKYNDYTGSVVLTVSGEAPTTYKISVAADPADFGTASADKQEAKAGDVVKLTATPADRSYEFVEWKTDTPDVTIKDDSFTMPASDVAITAVFKKKADPAATYQITVTADPAEGGAGSADKQEAAEGDVVTLAAVPLDGYEFVEWKTSTSGVTIKDNKFTMPASDVAVTAVFKKKAAPATTFAITYDANGGTGTMDKQTAEAGATVTLTANAFTRSGYTFTGWNTAKDGSGTTYSDKASVKVEGDMALYAQWKANSGANKAPKTGDSVIPLMAAAIISAIAVGALLFARRKMN